MRVPGKRIESGSHVAVLAMAFGVAGAVVWVSVWYFVELDPDDFWGVAPSCFGAAVGGWAVSRFMGLAKWRGVLLAIAGAVLATVIGAAIGAPLFFGAESGASPAIFQAIYTGPVLLVMLIGVVPPITAVWVVLMTGVQILARWLRARPHNHV